jgi:hypothetical protein
VGHTKHTQLIDIKKDSTYFALKEGKFFPSGYPKPYPFTFDPQQKPEIEFKATPYPPELTDKKASGIFYDNGHFLMLAIVDYSDSRGFF